MKAEYGSLAVEEPDDGPGRGRYFWCRCACGARKSVRVDHLRSGRIISCGCVGKRNAAAAKFKGHRDITGDYWRTIRDEAAVRGVVVDLDIETAYSLLERQGFACPYTGRPIHLGGPTGGNRSRNASLDRVDSGEPYSESNCEWVWKPLNLMKGRLPRSRFVSLSLAVADGGPPTGPADPSQVVSRTVWYRVRSTAAYRGWAVTAGLDYVRGLFVKQGGRCRLSGEGLILPKSSREAGTSSWTASLDRVSSVGDYEEGNLQWLHKDVNLMKRNLSDDEFISVCREIASHHRSPGGARG